MIKKKGWLDRVFMCVTIHDELVFEIDEDIAEEAVDLINEVMAVRTVKNLNWIVPLGTDIEFGDDWTVPLNLNKMVNKWDKKALKDNPALLKGLNMADGKVTYGGVAEAFGMPLTEAKSFVS